MTLYRSFILRHQCVFPLTLEGGVGVKWVQHVRGILVGKWYSRTKNSLAEKQYKMGMEVGHEMVGFHAQVLCPVSLGFSQL